MKRLSRYLLVGMLVTAMAVDCAATGRLCRPCCGCGAQISECPEACAPMPCVVSTSICESGTCAAGTTCEITDACYRCETTSADARCAGCAAAVATEWVPEPAAGERVGPAATPVEKRAPGSAEPQAPEPPISRPIDSPVDSEANPPVPVAVPDANDLPGAATPAPAPLAPPSAEIVGDRYSDDVDLFGAPTQDNLSTPAPAAEPAAPADGFDLFGEPITGSEELQAPAAPAPRPPFPELGTPESGQGEPEPEQPDTSKAEPVESEADHGDDPFGSYRFGQNLETTKLTKAGGLRSEVARTWTDDLARFQCQARLVQATAKGVILRRASGATLAVPYTRLGQADLQFVHEQVIACRAARARRAAAEKLAVSWAR